MKTVLMTMALVAGLTAAAPKKGARQPASPERHYFRCTMYVLNTEEKTSRVFAKSVLASPMMNGRETKADFYTRAVSFRALWDHSGQIRVEGREQPEHEYKLMPGVGTKIVMANGWEPFTIDFEYLDLSYQLKCLP